VTQFFAPAVGKILSWFLGAGGVILQISLVSKAVGVPFEHVKNNMTSKLPSWFPGASSAMLQRSLVPEIVDIPLEHVNMASDVQYSVLCTE
jgi:hypothetical protein